jgi:hypothetical protein
MGVHLESVGHFALGRRWSSLQQSAIRFASELGKLGHCGRPWEDVAFRVEEWGLDSPGWPVTGHARLGRVPGRFLASVRLWSTVMVALLLLYVSSVIV